MPNKIKKILIWGGKSQTRILLEFLDKKDKVIAIVDPFLKKNSFKTKIPFINNKKKFIQHVEKCNSFIVGIGGEYGYARNIISKKLIKLGLKPINVIHKSSYIDKTCMVGKGIQVMPGVNVNCFTKKIITSNETWNYFWITKKFIVSLGLGFIFVLQKQNTTLEVDCVSGKKKILTHWILELFFV